MNLKLKAILLFFFTFVIVENTLAQMGYEDVVYLKNGSIIHGIIIEENPSVSLKIQTRHKDVFVFRMEEIEKIIKRQTVQHKRGPDRMPRDTSNGPYTGFVLMIENHFGSGIEKHTYNQGAYAKHVVTGMMIKGIFSAGIGVGLDILSSNSNYGPEYKNIFNYNKHQFFVGSLFVDLRATPLPGKITPLVILDYGYGKALFSQQIHGGATFNAGLGVKYNVSRKTGVNLTLNYKAQNIWYDKTRNLSYNSTTINNEVYQNQLSLSFFCLVLGITL